MQRGQLKIFNEKFINKDKIREKLEEVKKYERIEMKKLNHKSMAFHYANGRETLAKEILEELLEGKQMEKEIEFRIIELYNLLDNIGWNISEQEKTLGNLEISLKEKEKGSIKDIENLKRELKRDGLYSEKLEEFIENYMKYYNK